MASSFKARSIIIVVSSFFILLFVAFLFSYIKRSFTSGHTEISEDVMVEKITQIGKLELVKYTMKDVLEKKELRLILPDKRILFVAAGEVTGCIDLTKITKDDIVRSSDDSVTVFLPKPEICYIRLDHKRSKVYDVSGSWFPADTKDMVEGIYKLAEQRLLENARNMDILGKTRDNAYVIFRPILENITDKKVAIRFR